MRLVLVCTSEPLALAASAQVFAVWIQRCCYTTSTAVVRLLNALKPLWQCCWFTVGVWLLAACRLLVEEQSLVRVRAEQASLLATLADASNYGAS
jgi:hypothetical protein